MSAGYHGCARSFFFIFVSSAVASRLPVVAGLDPHHGNKAAAAAAASAPHGLLCELQRNPALGVRAVPRFGWIVPPCDVGADHRQTAYELTVSEGSSYGKKDVVWESGKVVGDESTGVGYGGPALNPGTRYQWTVRTWTRSVRTETASTTATASLRFQGGDNYAYDGPECQSAESIPSTFVTALFAGWDDGARFVHLPTTAGTFAYFRKQLDVPAGVESASLFVTAVVEDPLLCGYRLYVNGTLVDIGPGRGEAPVMDGDGEFRSLPYTTLDVTPRLSSPGATVIALQTMHASSPSAILQLNVRLLNGEVFTVVTDESWEVFNGDAHRRPGPARNGGSAGTQFVEYIDARNEPVGWTMPGFDTSGGEWVSADAVAPSASQIRNLHPKMEPPMQVIDSVAVQSLEALDGNKFVADFGREFQGGLRLTVLDGTDGQTVHLSCGEALSGKMVTYTWGWEFDWTLRDGPQVLEQHKYMECRFVSLAFSGRAPSNFTLTAWKTHYPWYDDDSGFTSSNAMLNNIWELCRYTLNAASLDTYTDSNTRERRPYEADGIIAATGRLLLQRDFLWARHSHAWVIEHPTWPVEWKQLTPFLGWQDYMATGQPDLALAFKTPMYERTMIDYLDSTGLLNTSGMGRHIVDWMPDSSESDQTVRRGEFTASDHMSVSNAFAAHGLSLLAQMLAAGGETDRAASIAAKASRLMNNMKKRMWNGTAFCDGICSEVNGASLVMTNMFTLCFGMVPPQHIDSVWKTVTSWGLEEMGDYGAFWYQCAISSGYYAPYYDTPDDGSAMYTALTKCDEYSWCSGLQHDNLTMTRESWHAGTYSHEWGASAVVGVVWGLLGIHQTAPGFATFIVKPKLGGLGYASIKVPTIRGFINLTTSPGMLDIDIPCNTLSTLCLPRSARTSGDQADGRVQATKLMLDGVAVPTVVSGGHLCVGFKVGCGIGGAARSLRAQPLLQATAG